MSSNPNVLGYYVYSLVTIGVFIYNYRNWKFIRMTLLYYVFLTSFAYLLIYGSAYNLQSHLDQLHQEGLLTAFPFTISGGGPDVNTVSRTNPNYFSWTIALISFFVTFPQAVARGARLQLDKTNSPKRVMDAVLNYYDRIRKILRRISKIVLPTINDVYIVGEWIFVLVTISSLVSPFPMQSWYLMLLGCFLILLLTGTDIAIGAPGPLSRILRLFIPGIVVALQSFSALVLTVIIFLVSAALSSISGIILFNIMQNILHTKNPGIIAMSVVFAVSIGVLWVSCTYLSKAIEFLIAKLIEWLGIKVID